MAMLRLLGVCLFATVLISGCAAPTPSARASTTSVASPLPGSSTSATTDQDTPAPSGTDCITSFPVVDRMSSSIAFYSSVSELVVTGTVLDLGPGLWATPDGRSPVMHISQALPSQIYHLAHIAIDGVGKTSAGHTAAPGTVLSVRIEAGEMGCSVFGYTDRVNPKVGDRVGLFLGRRRDEWPSLTTVADYDALDIPRPVRNDIGAADFLAESLR